MYAQIRIFVLSMMWFSATFADADQTCFSETMRELCLNHYLHGDCAQRPDTDEQLRCHLMDKTTTKCKRMGCLNGKH